MLGFYNTNLNNMYVNQNYGYGLSTVNQSQQQASLFSGYSQGYQQQSSGDMNFMMLSMINSILPVILGSYANQQAAVQPQVQQPVVQAPVQQVVQQPQQLSSSAFLQKIVMMLLKSLIPGINDGNTTGKTPVEVYQEDVTVESAATGDPHFAINGQQSFDFQGKNEGLYKMLDNSDVSLNAKFAASGGGGATIIKDQNLEFKDEGINLVSHADGKFEILQNGKEIGDETTYNTDQKVIDLLKKEDIIISKEGNSLKTTHGKRTLVQNLNGGNIDNISDTLMKGDKGLLTQTVGAIDEDKDGITKLGTDLNKDGKIDEKDDLKYQLKDQFMVHTEIQGSSCATITPELEEAMKKDIAEGIKAGSAVKGFSTSHGYDARQWNEYVGGKLYTLKEDKLLAA